MKVLTITITFLLFTFFSHSQIEMNSTGKVGIGTSPTSSQLRVDGYSYFDGDVFFKPDGSSLGYYLEIIAEPLGATLRPTSNSSGYLGASSKAFLSTYTHSIYRNNEYTLSDIKVKTNIKPIVDPLQLISRLEGKIFDYTEDAYPNVAPETKAELLKQGKGVYGFIAQEVKEVLPRSVVYNEELDLHHLSTDAIIPLLVEGTKIQQATIDSLSQEISNLKNALNDIVEHNIKMNSTETELREDATKFKSAKLSQNAPNPVSKATIINYDLPGNIKSASLNVYNVNGKQIESISLGSNKSGAVTLEAGGLKPGIYVYSLIADGVLIDTKQMVITE